MSLKRGQRGFTLIEVLLAISILATLTIIVWAAVVNIFDTRDFMGERHERFQIVRLSMNRMATEISGAYLAGPDHGGEPIPGEEETPAMGASEDGEEEPRQRMGFREPVQFGLIGRSDRVHFTSFSHVRTIEGQKTSHHAQIGYFLRRGQDDDGRSITSLMRRENTHFDDDLTRGGIVYTMVPEVESIKFEYWDPGEVQVGTMREIAQGRWVSDWDTTRREQAGRLPPRIRITMVLPPQGPRGRSETFTTQATVHVTEVLEF
ncbi:MAG: type II secretion system protein J [Bradymonadaceae bacterium]